MGILVNGKWTNEPQPPADGRFSRPESRFRHHVTADGNYTGKVTVPTLRDKQTRTIVTNESSEIIRRFNSALDFSRPHHRAALSAVSA